MNKKIAIAAILVVVVVVAGGLLVAFWPKSTQQSNVIYWTKIAPVDQLAAIQSGKVDAAVGWEPYSSKALLSGTTDVIAWSGQIWPNHPCCVLAVRYSGAFPNNTANRDLVARVLRADIDADNWIVKTINEGSGANYTALLNMGAAFSNTNASVVQSAINHIEYSYNLTTGVRSALVNFTVMFRNLGQYSDNSSYGGYATASDFINATLDAGYLNAAMAVPPSATILGTVRIGYLNGDLHQFARVVAMNTTLWGGKTLFEKYGVEVDTSIKPYANGPAVMAAFLGGNIDLGYLGAPPAIINQINAHTGIKIIALVNAEGSAIVAKKPIASLQDLVGKIVATPGPGSIQHLLLLYYATQNGYQLKLAGT